MPDLDGVYLEGYYTSYDRSTVSPRPTPIMRSQQQMDRPVTGQELSNCRGRDTSGER